MNAIPTLYGSLLEAQLAANPTETSTLRVDIADMQACSDLSESALRYGAFLVGAEDTIECETYELRLRMVASYLLEHSIGDPLVMEDDRFYEVQAALGMIAGPITKNSDFEVQPTIPVDYARALQNLTDHLSELSPGEAYTLSPAQVLSLAAPDMAFSRWQRYRLLQQARDHLTGQGYIFCHNNGRGKSSAYTIGRPHDIQAGNPTSIDPPRL